jgi:hypothetical protein
MPQNGNTIYALPTNSEVGVETSISHEESAYSGYSDSRRGAVSTDEAEGTPIDRNIDLLKSQQAREAISLIDQGVEQSYLQRIIGQRLNELRDRTALN